MCFKGATFHFTETIVRAAFLENSTICIRPCRYCESSYNLRRPQNVGKSPSYFRFMYLSTYSEVFNKWVPMLQTERNRYADRETVKPIQRIFFLEKNKWVYIGAQSICALDSKYEKWGRLLTLIIYRVPAF